MFRRPGLADTARGQAPEDAAPAQRRATGGKPSLRARAIALLSGREHSSQELRRKLAPHAESEDQLDTLLAELRALGYLSEERFVQSLIQRRSARYGLRRIARELDEHGVATEIRAPMMQSLAEGERDRALAAWQKRFGKPPVDLAERAKQHRFLAQRGFDGETIAWVMRQARDQQGSDI